MGKINEMEIDPFGKAIRVVPTQVTKKQDKFEWIIQLVLKFAKVEGYDDENRIVIRGEIIPGTNMATLLKLAFSKRKQVPGVEDFVNLMNIAEINPEFIVNESIKSRLSSLSKNVTEVEPSVTVAKKLDLTEEIAPPKKIRKTRSKQARRNSRPYRLPNIKRAAFLRQIIKPPQRWEYASDSETDS